MPRSRHRQKTVSQKKASRHNRNLRVRAKLAEMNAEHEKVKAAYARDNGKAAYATLLAVLAASDGVVVSQSTIDRVTQDYDHLYFVVQRVPNEGDAEPMYCVNLADKREQEQVEQESLGESLAEGEACDTSSPASGASSSSPAETDSISNSPTGKDTADGVA